MNTYEFVAVQPDGAAIRGRAAAHDELALDRDLEERGLVLSSARVVVSERRRAALRLQHDDLISLTTQLATITGAGVHIVEGLEGIGKRLARPASRRLVEDIVRSLRAGARLSDALDQHPKSFPHVYRASVRAGESSGSLDTVLMRLAKHLEWSRAMKATAVQALIYPAILMLALCGLVAILLYFVLPRIVTLFPGGRDQLPAETRFVMASSDFVVANIVWLVLGGAAAVTAFIAFRRDRRGREFLDGTALKLPKFGRVAQQLAVSSFASTASVMQGAGCDVFSTLSVSGETCGNAAMAAAFARVGERVRQGRTITQALEVEPCMDPMLVQMVAVGENTGQLDQCLLKLSSFYDEDIPRSVKRFLAVLEPAMLICAGVVVGSILLAALMPIFKLYESIG